MLEARITIVSDRAEVVAELQPLIRAGKHLASVVPTGRELIELLDAGMVPDIVISDLGSLGAYQRLGYIGRFRELNRAGCHMVVTDAEEPSAPELSPRPTRFPELRRPFQPPAVRATLEEALGRVERELSSTRAHVARSLALLRREVQDARADMVRVLATTIAMRDMYMAGHAERVAKLSGRMAGAIGLGDDARDLLATAAQLHEIGKISLPVALLQKKESLSADELERIRAHGRTGAGILRGVSSLAVYAPLVEHFGTPYEHLPPGVAVSPDAPLIGILRVADVWDAMTSDRSYRSAMPRSYWEPLLQNGAGTLFDPVAVDALFSVLDVDAPLEMAA